MWLFYCVVWRSKINRRDAKIVLGRREEEGQKQQRESFECKKMMTWRREIFPDVLHLLPNMCDDDSRNEISLIPVLTTNRYKIRTLGKLPR